jgi:beta-glucosidase
MGRSGGIAMWTVVGRDRRAFAARLGLVISLLTAMAASLASLPATTIAASHGPGVAAPAAGSAPGPTPFLWGVATSSYQVEGGIDCSDPNLPCNDYDYFNRDQTIHDTVEFNSGKVGPTLDLAPAGIADNAWDPATYKRDFDNAAMLGLNSFRFSLEWGRIEPQQDVWNETAIQHYVDMVDAMRARGLQPVVTLNHFTLPIWVLKPSNYQACVIAFCYLRDDDTDYTGSLRGWDNTATIAEWVQFVKKVVPIFKGKVDYWLTVNEPVGSMVGVGYIGGVWSPGFLSDGGKAKNVLHNLIEAHVQAYNAISDCTANPDCDDVDADGDGKTKLVGFAHAMGPTVASPPGPAGNAGLNAIAADNFDYFLSDYMVNAVVNGDEDLVYLNSNGLDRTGPVTHHPDWQNKLDYLGINYYRRFHVYHDDKLPLAGTGFLGGNQHNSLYGEPEPHELLNDLGWAIYPEGLYQLVMRAKNKWSMPVMVTENGTPERTDRNRAAHIVAHVREIARAIADGATVIGYMHWTLMDNWELQENFHQPSQFGLFHIDRNDPDPANPDLHRWMTEGAMAYQQVIDESRALSSTGAPTERAVATAQQKFGAITADGTSVLPPSRTHGRFWEGDTAEGKAALYLGYTKANGAFKGMIYWFGLRQWRGVELMIDSVGPFLRERRYDDALAAFLTRDIRVSYSNGIFTFPGGASNTLSPIPGTGLWRWAAGDTPWGTNDFYVSKLEGLYAGKYLTFSSPGPNDEPTPVCGPGGCVPDVSGSLWKSFAAVSVGAGEMRLDGRGRENEELFDVSLALSAPTPGTAGGTTIRKHTGTFAVSKAYNVAGAHFHLTGYWSPAGDNTWIGQRDGSTVSKFHFLESRGIFQEFPQNPAPVGGVADQYAKENDPTSVMPLVAFSFRDNGHGGAFISWEAGGRIYVIDAGFPFCLSVQCTGDWEEIGGRSATRVSERFPVVAAELAGQTVETNAAGGANVTLQAPPAMHLDGTGLTYLWTGDFGAATGANPTVFLGLGSHQVCVAIHFGLTAVATRCATIVVRDTTPPTITCGAPDGLWHPSDVSILCTANDLGSGLANVGDATFSLSTNVPAGVETANAQTATRLVCDNAANCATAGPIGGNRVDRKAPLITFVTPAADASYVLNSVQTVAFGCTDGGSGLATCLGTLAVGATLPTATVGARTFTVSTTDQVANADSRTISYAIAYGVCLLYDPTKPTGAPNSTVPLRLKLCDSLQVNVSASSIVLTATKRDGQPPPPPFTGTANVGYVFRYQPGLGGYVYNLDTSGMSPGTHTITFMASGDPTEHTIAFVLK